MALCAGRTLFCRGPFKSSITRINYMVNHTRCVTIKVIPKEAESNESYDERNMRLKRELSPHLSIYKPQLTSMLSITHRMTGMALAGYAAIFGLGALVLPYDFAHYVTMIEGLHLSTPTLLILKFILSYPAGYHIANGVRHLAWDAGKFLRIREVYSTGYIMLAGSVGLSILFAIL